MSALLVLSEARIAQETRYAQELAAAESNWYRAWRLRVFWLMLLLFVGVVVTGTARGQGPRLTQPIDSSALIRLHLSSGDRVRGRMLVQFTPNSDQLIFCHYPRTPCRDLTDPAVQSVPVTAIGQIEIARGSRAKRGAVIGGVVGALLGFTSATVGNGLCERECVNPGLLTVGGLINGALWGALIGSTKPVWVLAP